MLDLTLQIDPNDKVAFYNKGIAYRNLNEYEKAIECYDLAVKLDPKYKEALNNKGFCLNELK